MKANWPTVPLTKAVMFRGGGTPPKKNPKYWGGPIPWVSPKDMKSAFVDSSQDTITRDALAGSAVKVIPEGATLIVVRSGILARTVPVAVAARELTVNQDLKALVPGEQVDPRFLHYFMQSAEPYLLSRVTRGATVHKLDSEVLESLQVPLPSRGEQQCIVAILDEAFAGIATAVANTDKNLANARELFESYLNAVFAKKDEECSKVSIGDIAQVKGGKRVPKGLKLQREPTDYPYISVADFNGNGSVDSDGIKYLSAEAYQKIKRYTISSKDLYISIAGTIGKTGIVPPELDGANLTENACRLVFEEGIYNWFIYFFTRTESFRSQALKNTRTTAQPKLALERLRTIRLALPSIDEQYALVQQFEEIQRQTVELESICQQKLVALAELKQSLLKKAFAGELTADSLDELEAASA